MVDAAAVCVACLWAVGGQAGPQLGHPSAGRVDTAAPRGRAHDDRSSYSVQAVLIHLGRLPISVVVQGPSVPVTPQRARSLMADRTQGGSAPRIRTFRPVVNHQGATGAAHASGRTTDERPPKLPILPWRKGSTLRR